MGRILAIGDVHGCYQSLLDLVAFVEVSSDDHLVMLGDYVDRGPDSERVIQWLIDQSQRCRLTPLRGNHEVMMLNARTSVTELQRWYKFGGAETLASYTDDADGIGSLDDVTPEHWQFLSKRLLPYFETDTHIFVHGIVSHAQPMSAQPDSSLYWGNYWNGFPGHVSGKIVICGHKSQDSGLPATNGHAICVDTGVCKGRWLTCMDIDSETVWQSNQSGDTRTFRLKSGLP